MKYRFPRQNEERLQRAAQNTVSILELYYNQWGLPVKASSIAQKLRTALPKDVKGNEFLNMLASRNYIMLVMGPDACLYAYPKECLKMPRDLILETLLSYIENKKERANEARSIAMKRNRYGKK